MKELSLHILDIVQNSVAAGAKLITLDLIEDENTDLLEFSIKDDGCGMTEETLKKVTDPFTTGRTTRRVGLGIPLLKAAAELTGGGLELTSEPGVGTTVTARFVYDSIDRQPLGNMAETMLGLITSYENIDFVYYHRVNEKKFTIDTREIKGILGEVSLNEPEVVLWLSGFLNENETELYK